MIESEHITDELEHAPASILIEQSRWPWKIYSPAGVLNCLSPRDKGEYEWAWDREDGVGGGVMIWPRFTARVHEQNLLMHACWLVVITSHLVLCHIVLAPRGFSLKPQCNLCILLFCLTVYHLLCEGGWEMTDCICPNFTDKPILRYTFMGCVVGGICVLRFCCCEQ